ncbi:MAG: RusA family crossover junction endodeoxyribonuclease [Chloroflexi bacterium]|nr:RusA family crossover junction endodeoxyribonuclease [Chloroflexota bacterium]
MQIIIPFKTPTYNHLHGHRGFRWYLKPEGKELQKKIKEIVVNSLPFFSPDLNKGLKVEVEIYENWLCKDGSIKRKDLDNRQKFLIDCIFNSLDIDDKYIFEHTMRKIQSDEEKAIINIEVLNEK